MPHNVFGKKLNRDTGQRLALLKGLAGALIRSESIETTEAKAKAATSLVEKMVTLARRGSVSDLRAIEEVIGNKELIDKLVHNIAPRFKNRPGGFVRLVKIGNRSGDNAPLVRMEFTASEAAPEPAKPAPAKKPARSPKTAAPKKVKTS